MLIGEFLSVGSYVTYDDPDLYLHDTVGNVLVKSFDSSYVLP